MAHRFQRQPLERIARGLFCCLTVWVAGFLIPGSARAEQSIRGLWLRLFHWQAPVSAEESALAPIAPGIPMADNPLHALRSRYSRQRLAALAAIHQTGEASRQVMEALVQSTQDKNPDVARQAAKTLAGLCRSGHEEDVVRAFVRAIERETRSVQSAVDTGFAFSIPDRAEEQRVQAILNDGR